MSEIKYDKKRLNPVKSILVSQPDPKDDNSPFHRLAKQYDLKVDFKPFIILIVSEIEGSFTSIF